MTSQWQSMIYKIYPRQNKKKSVDQLVSNIDAILGEAVTTRIEQEQRTNSTIQALAFASLVNNILTGTEMPMQLNTI